MFTLVSIVLRLRPLEQTLNLEILIMRKYLLFRAAAGSCSNLCAQ
jgi:hypothetical protein